MDKYVIEGGKKLTGSISASGSKNSALPILAATILTDEECVINGVPHLRDTYTMIELLSMLGKEIIFEGNRVIVKAGRLKSYVAPYDLVRKMRASICVLGPVVARYGRVDVSMPGGCSIGPRPIDLHIKGLEALGCDISIEHGYLKARARELKGTTIYLAGKFGSTVLGTDNVMMAATLANGKTIIEKAAMEPEVSDLAGFLKCMGARINGEGTSTIEIEGVDRLYGCEYTIIPDRIEGATLLCAFAITGGKGSVSNIKPSHINTTTDMLIEMGCELDIGEDSIYIKAPDRLTSAEIETMPYPGFPTDMQAIAMSMMSMANGISIITENVYPERFIHVGELIRMGADIKVENASAIIKGVERLSGAPIMASDLRAGAALVLAGLAASGQTMVSRIYHIDRGYEKLEDKLAKIGANIKRIR